MRMLDSEMFYRNFKSSIYWAPNLEHSKNDRISRHLPLNFKRYLRSFLSKSFRLAKELANNLGFSRSELDSIWLPSSPCSCKLSWFSSWSRFGKIAESKAEVNGAKSDFRLLLVRAAGGDTVNKNDND